MEPALVPVGTENGSSNPDHVPVLVEESQAENQVTATDNQNHSESEGKKMAIDDGSGITNDGDGEQGNSSNCKRTYKKNPPYHTLTGKYWTSPEDEVQVSTRPRRANAGSLMKSFVQILTERPKAQTYRSRNRNSEKTIPSTEGTNGTVSEKPRSRGRPPRKSAEVVEQTSEDVEIKTVEAPKEKGTTRKSKVTPPAAPTPRLTGTKPPRTYRRAGAGRPGRKPAVKLDVSSADKNQPTVTDSTNTNSSTTISPKRQSKKENGKPVPVKHTVSKMIKLVTQKKLAEPLLPVAKKSSVPRPQGVQNKQKCEEVKSIPQPVASSVQNEETMGSEWLSEEVESPSQSGIRTLRIRKVGPTRVSSAMALQAALSIPNDLLPTSHEEFLDKHGWKFGEKGMVSKQKVRKESTDGDSVPIITEASKEKSAQGDDERGQKENIVPSDLVDDIGVSTPNSAEAEEICLWEDEERASVVKMGNNQLLINGATVIDLDYTNYIKESDVPIPYDPDVIFKSEKPLTSNGELPVVGTDSNSPSDEETQETSSGCKLEACKLGCVCKSLRLGAPARQYCYRDTCFSGCCCIFTDHSLIDRAGQAESIKSRLRRRVTLLNWRKITNGIVSESEEEGIAKTKVKKSGTVKINVLRKRSMDGAPGLQEPARKQLKKLSINLQNNKPPMKEMPPLRICPFVRPNIDHLPSLIQKPSLSSLLRPDATPKKVYSSQPCQIKISEPDNQMDEDDLNDHEMPSMSTSTSVYKTANSNFRISAQLGKSFAVVRPNGLALAKLTFEDSKSKTVMPRAVRKIEPGCGSLNSKSIPHLYLPVPENGKIWLFFQVPTYEYNASIWLPEIGVHLPAKKIHFMELEANHKGQTGQLYMEFDDQEKLIEDGLLNFVYLVPNLHSVLVYGPVAEERLKPVERNEENLKIESFKTETDNDSKSHLDKEILERLEAAGTEIMEIEDESNFEDNGYDDDEDGNYVEDTEDFVERDPLVQW